MAILTATVSPVRDAHAFHGDWVDEVYVPVRCIFIARRVGAAVVIEVSASVTVNGASGSAPLPIWWSSGTPSLNHNGVKVSRRDI